MPDPLVLMQLALLASCGLAASASLLARVPGRRLALRSQ